MCNNAVKSTKGCFVTAINGQCLIVMLNLLQNLGIYNGIHYPTQSNIIQFPLSYEKNKGKVYCQHIHLSSNFSCSLNIQPNSVSPQEL